MANMLVKQPSLCHDFALMLNPQKIPNVVFAPTLKVGIPLVALAPSQQEIPQKQLHAFQAQRHNQGALQPWLLSVGAGCLENMII